MVAHIWHRSLLSTMNEGWKMEVSACYCLYMKWNDQGKCSCLVFVSFIEEERNDQIALKFKNLMEWLQISVIWSFSNLLFLPHTTILMLFQYLPYLFSIPNLYPGILNFNWSFQFLLLSHWEKLFTHTKEIILVIKKMLWI